MPGEASSPAETRTGSAGRRRAGLRPGLAESWQVDETDKTKWVFKLRPGIKFHDGSILSVDDVVYTLLKTRKRSL